ncbi:MAG: hypothetical protein K5694_02545 [Bacilli bacterium]|nr:hypothetical protein [Bacilli bacterium]
MKKLKAFLWIEAALVAISAGAIAITTTLSVYVKYASSNGSYGQVALRSYFETGAGTEENPYVITRPRHMYNLSRLQGLGVFGAKTYFQLGLEELNGADPSAGPLCYLNDSSMTTVPFLDMSTSTYTNNPINAIGSESLPFYGEFDGQSLEIKNLNVYADPEDAGLFGYTAHGSLVHDLFLSNVTINTLGYTDDYVGLYGPSSTLANGVSYTYDPDTSVSDNEITFSKSVDNYGYMIFNAVSTENFTYDGEATIPQVTYSYPNNDGYKYKTLISGNLISESNGVITPNTDNIFSLFGDKRDLEGVEFPLQSSTSVSLIASVTDSHGLEHTKVLLTLSFLFTLESINSTAISMETTLGLGHSNNIGLVIGHCDGSLHDCYVYKGSFKMNDGENITGLADTYNALENASSLGLIGLTGNTVNNLAALEADAATKTGKDIGVLDFTTVYNDVINSSSFSNSESLNNGSAISYTPISTSKYLEYLRYRYIESGGSQVKQYVTKEEDTVSFRGNKVISNKDLGVFTIATDSSGNHVEADVYSAIDKSLVSTEDVTAKDVDDNDRYYLYYATGEYDANSGIAFSKYRDSFNSDSPSDFYLGHHLPSYDEISSDVFAYREWRQNYFFRFPLDAQRAAKSFYFSDVDTSTPGGSFLSNYFYYKLIDQNGDPIPKNNAKSGVMLRNVYGKEITSLSASFATPNLSHYGDQSRTYMYCVESEEHNNPAANMVNFEIKTAYANVTVVAGLVDTSKPAALGVYKIDDDSLYKGTAPARYIDKDFESPDYAFFMPTDDHLAYFDYKTTYYGSLSTGHVGVYNNDGSTFTEITSSNNTIDATMPKTYSYGSEYGYTSGKTRLFAHTFKLPQGRYCLGSATGPGNGASGSLGIAKIFYVCAQGQNDGQLEFIDNTYASNDVVRNVDFTKQERFTYDSGTGTTTTNITLGDASTYDADDPRLDNQRCYVMLTNSDRSLFAADTSDISFKYEDNIFKITTTDLSKMTHISVNNYGRTHSETLPGLVNTSISLFGAASSTDDVITYTY